MTKIIKGGSIYNHYVRMLEIADILKREGYSITDAMTINQIKEIYYSQERINNIQ